MKTRAKATTKPPVHLQTMIEATNYRKIEQKESDNGLNGSQHSNPVHLAKGSAPPSSGGHNEFHLQDDNEETPIPMSISFRAYTTESLQRRWAVALFSITTVLLFADQNLMSPNLSQIAKDFGFDDNQRDQKLGGDIALAFFVLGAPASFVVGALGDTYNRSRLFALTVGIGEGACLATFFARTYPELYCCRAITGFALGGALPLIYSILGDLYAAEDRHLINAIVGIGTGVGISVGQGVAGFLGPSFGWRLPFLVISVPALILAALVLMTVEDPERGAMEEAVLNNPNGHTASSSTPVEMVPLHESTHRSNLCVDVDVLAAPPVEEKRDDAPRVSAYCETFASLLSTPTVVLSLLQGAPGCIPWGICNSFLNDFLAENRGMTVEAATTVILIFGVGNFFGLVLGGTGGTYLYRRDKRYPALLAGCLAISGCFPFWVLLNSVHQGSNPLFVLVVALSAGLFSGGTGPIVKATLQNVTLPQARGQAFALFNTFDDFGRGLGPVFIAWLIVNFNGRTNAFNIGVIGWMLCGVMNLAMFFTVIKDEDRVQQILTANLSANAR